MSLAQDDILRRIKVALRDVPVRERPDDVPVMREYRQVGSASPAELIERFANQLVDYKAKVTLVREAELGRAITAACAARGVRRLCAPADLPESWAPADVELLRDIGGALSNEQLDASDGV